MTGHHDIEISGFSNGPGADEVRSLTGAIVQIPVGGPILSEGASWNSLFRLGRVLSVTPRVPPETCPACESEAELVDDFDNWWRGTRWRTSLRLTPDQVHALDLIQRLVDSLPSETYTEQSVRTDKRWSDLRDAARSAMNAFGWPPELPPPGRSVYVGGS